MAELLNSTVGRMFTDTAARFPDRSAVETGSGLVSYAQLDTLTDALAASLLKLGVKKGDRIGIWCGDRPHFLYIYLAAEKIGAVAVLFNTALGAPELSALLKKTDVELLFYDEGSKGVSFADTVRALGLTGARYLPDFIAQTGSVPAQSDIPALERAKAAVEPGDVDAVIFTSGTSGTAKGVETTHFARVNVAMAQVRTVDMNENDKLCVALPMFHCFGLTGVVLAALACGACLYFPPQRRTRYLLDAVSEHKCTILSAVPTLFGAIIAHTDLDRYDLSSLRTGYIGGSVYTSDFFIRVEQALGFSLAPSLGQTEATAGLTFISPKEDLELRCSSVGRFMDGIEGRVTDIRSGEPLPVGREGEIQIRGWSVMLRYVGEPELTAETVDSEGWLHTGDLAYMDEHGCLHMTGRLKEIIIRGGENIAPGEIEAVISADPRVREVKAVAVPDDHYGEEVCACVVPASPAGTITAEEIVSLCSSMLAAYKVPRYVLFLDELPKTSSGKISLSRLKELAKEKLSLK